MMSRTASLLIAALACTGTQDGLLSAQSVQRTTLGALVTEFPEPFSSISGIRELSDGRLMVSDRLEKAVRILDFASGTMREIGRVGSGPGEYQMPGSLLPLAADSTLLVDFGNMRLTVIGPSGQMHRSSSMQQSDRFLNPTGSDAFGRLYFDDLGSFSAGPDELPDEVAVLRWDPAADVFDTVGYMPRPEARAMSSGGGGGARFSVRRMSPLQARDAWGVAPDGRLAIARAEPYRVEWLVPGGSKITGSTVPYEPVRVTEEDKETFSNRSAVGVMITSGGEGSGSRTVTIPSPDADELDWPEAKPAFQPSGISVAPDGTAWVRRYVAHDAPERYDVFDASGNRIRHVELPAGRRLEGFGDGCVYLVRVDEDDLQWIEKYERKD
jgi:hypothetical protein